MRTSYGIIFAAIFAALAVRAEPLFISASADVARGACETLVVTRAVSNQINLMGTDPAKSLKNAALRVRRLRNRLYGRLSQSHCGDTP